ncbi:serine peptidase [Streptomyces lunalinharesii]|uniref:Serine peptidase n=1 Tax=Streptomyces lunalinharesii TaxID=333384 RepID=A0ABP6EYZ3_9ACTN
MGSIVVVHGVRNWKRQVSPSVAAQSLADSWQLQLTAGYENAGLRHVEVPQITAAYYGHLINDTEAQGIDESAESLSAAEQSAVLAWLGATSLPTEPAESQSWGGLPLRQTIDLVARRRGIAAKTVSRIAVAFIPEVYRYLASPTRRAAAQQAVADSIEASGTSVLVAHSLGSIVAYETLHARPDLPIRVLITLGSPLGLPEAVFDILNPAPVGGYGARPPKIAHWTNIADSGDLVALPRRLGDRFPVDVHEEAHMAAVDFHTLSTYLSCGLTAAAIAPHCT